MLSRLLTAAVFVGGGVLLLAILAHGGSDTALAADPTCSDVLEVAVHGQHVVGDYVTGIGRGDIDWPPTSGVVGEAVAGKGAAVHGGPGPGFHFPNGFAPGASFCLAQAQSPGFHAGH